MKLHRARAFVDHLSHAGHETALVLVAIATGAELLRALTPTAGEVERVVADVLHWVHWIALSVAIVYLFIRVGLTRNVAKELVGFIEQEPEEPVISLFPAETRYAYQELQISAVDVAFVAKTHGSGWEELSTLNERGFDGSSFEIDRKKLEQRNAEWVRKNAKLFMLVRLKDQPTEYIGYTAIVPLNDVGADVYFRGLIKDRDLPASLICRAGEPSRALLIFAVVLNVKWRDRRSLGRRHLNRLLKAVEYHVNVVATAHAGHTGGCVVWTQSEHKSIVKHLRERGFTSTKPPTRAADGFELLGVRITPPRVGSTAAVVA